MAYLDQDENNEFYTFIYYNQEFFNQQKYGEEAIQRVRRIELTSISPKLPKDLEFKLKGNHLKDTSDLFQITEAEVLDYYSNTIEVDDITWGPFARIKVNLQDEMI